MEYISEPMPVVVSKPEKIRNGLVWYAALVPALGLFLERYTLNKYLGFMVWGIVLIMRPVCCLIDLHILSDKEKFSCGKGWALLPTVYLFKRCLKLKQNTALAVVCFICLSYGVIGNGFTTGMMVDDERILGAVQNERVSSISELKKEAVPDSVSNQLEKTLEGISWDIKSDGDVRTITVSGTVKDSKDKAELIFKVTHDGYTYTDFKLDKVTKNGEALEGDERKELLVSLLGKGEG